MEWTWVAEVDWSRTLMPSLETELTTTCTSKGVTYEELTATELISNPLRKVIAEERAAFWLLSGMKATMLLPELQEESEAVSIW